jgi:hypothetical protein
MQFSRGTAASRMRSATPSRRKCSMLRPLVTSAKLKLQGRREPHRARTNYEYRYIRQDVSPSKIVGRLWRHLRVTVFITVARSKQKFHDRGALFVTRRLLQSPDVYPVSRAVGQFLRRCRLDGACACPLLPRAVANPIIEIDQLEHRNRWRSSYTSRRRSLSGAYRRNMQHRVQPAQFA